MHVGIKYECRKKYVSGALFIAIYDSGRIHDKGYNVVVV